MPLLMCPNDNAPMQTLERSGVQFDMCPTCRGVWLDRGELEKLMEGATAEGRAAAPAPQQAAPYPPQTYAPQTYPPQAYRDERRPDHRGHDDRYRRDDDYRYKKKKRLDIFDIFD